ncbi:MAG: AMP-binding protein, partial [Rhizobacter sp.]|nr:AMP-binding protein [Rhizobacter sp.]
MKPTIEYQGASIDAETFLQRTLRAANALQAAGVCEGEVIALLMRNSPQLLELMLAARWIGALWCPINWHFRSGELQFILSDCGAKVLVVDAGLQQSLAGLDLGSIRVFVAGNESERSGDPGGLRSWARFRDSVPPLDSAACLPRGAMFYTSGTTGRPKGIRRAAASAEQVAQGQQVLRHVLGFEPGMRALL